MAEAVSGVRGRREAGMVKNWRGLAAPGGIVVAVLAWLLPVSLKSVGRGLLRSAGADTPSVAAFGRDLVNSEKIGPALLLLGAAKAVGDPGAAALESELGALSARQPALVAWGGWDASLDPIFNLRLKTDHTSSTPVMSFLITGASRDAVRAYLSNSGSIGVQTVLKTRDVTSTGRFVPASRAGGQPLDALILLTGLLYQGEHLSPPLQREVRALAETAVQRSTNGLFVFVVDDQNPLRAHLLYVLLKPSRGFAVRLAAC